MRLKNASDNSASAEAFPQVMRLAEVHGGPRFKRKFDPEMSAGQAAVAPGASTTFTVLNRISMSLANDQFST